MTKFWKRDLKLIFIHNQLFCLQLTVALGVFALALAKPEAPVNSYLPPGGNVPGRGNGGGSGGSGPSNQYGPPAFGGGSGSFGGGNGGSGGNFGGSGAYSIFSIIKYS